ncbi:MAG: CPBP family glutamic-type intramembrane protease [Candidatus Thorarchaeota archaeon]
MDQLAKNVALYTVIAYGYAWLIGLAALQMNLPLMIVEFVAALGPLFGAVIVTFRQDGRSGIRSFFSRAFQWRFSSIWCVVALVIPIAVLSSSSILAVSIGGADVPASWFSFDSGFLGFVSFVVLLFVFNGIGEEMGWRGFLLPQLQSRFGSLAASILVGVIWALWHIPLFFIQGSVQYGNSVIDFIILLVSWTIIMAMLCGRANGNVIPAIILHETQNLIAFNIIAPSGSGVYELPLYLLIALMIIPFLPRPLVTDVVLPKRIFKMKEE